MIFKQKLKASLLHLSLSLVLVTLIIGTTLFFLFPTLFIQVTDFKEVASIIISVDLILGPLLTFVVFNPEKKKRLLYLDFAVIGAIQLSALFYGAYSLFQIHPVYVTFNVDRFTIVTAKDAEPQKALVEEYKISKMSAGKLAYAKMPEDQEKQNELLLNATMGGEDLEQKEEYYEPVKDNLSSIIARSLNPEKIFKNTKERGKAKDFLMKYEDKLDTYAFLPLNSLKKDAIIVIDKKTAEPVATLDIDPWVILSKNETSNK
jgi:hypothetical protein